MLTWPLLSLSMEEHLLDVAKSKHRNFLFRAVVNSPSQPCRYCIADRGSKSISLSAAKRRFLSEAFSEKLWTTGITKAPFQTLSLALTPPFPLLELGGTVGGRFKAYKKERVFDRGMAGPTRLELATSGVTGRRSNQLNYDPAQGLRYYRETARDFQDRVCAPGAQGLYYSGSAERDSA